MPKARWESDGKEDKFIEELIEEGKFTKHTTAKSLQKDYPKVFLSFNKNVVRNHMNDMKRKNGLYCMNLTTKFYD